MRGSSDLYVWGDFHALTNNRFRNDSFFKTVGEIEVFDEAALLRIEKEVWELNPGFLIVNYGEERRVYNGLSDFEKAQGNVFRRLTRLNEVGDLDCPPTTRVYSSATPVPEKELYGFCFNEGIADIVIDHSQASLDDIVRCFVNYVSYIYRGRPDNQFRGIHIGPGYILDSGRH
jgi:hypothetical protein